MNKVNTTACKKRVIAAGNTRLHRRKLRVIASEFHHEGEKYCGLPAIRFICEATL